MAPIATTLLFPSANLTSSAVVVGMPSSTSSIYAHSQNTSPKQFIPVGALTVFLILLFFSHLMRYPRFLYVSHELLDSHSRSTQNNSNPDQLGHRNFLEKEPDVGAGFYRRPSFSGPKGLSSFQPHTEAIYNEPTVRLVRAYHNCSPEPRVYLPEEITLPSPSQTLVDSPCTNSSIMDHQSVLPRVYLPPVSPEKFELGLSHQQADVFYTNHDSPLSSDLQWMPSSSRWPPGLSTLPFAHSSTGCYARITTSSDMLALPFVQDQLQGSAKSISSAVEDLELGLSHLSPMPSPPPLAHAHPILVRRALSPWRRRSCPLESYDSFLQMDTDITTGASSHRHRPSVPSRLRYFITRSVATSLSGSLTHSTPVSSSARKCSESSRPRSRPNSHPEAPILKSCHADAVARFSDDLLNASAKMSALATTPDIQFQSSTFDYQSPTPVNPIQQSRFLNACKQPPGTEEPCRHSNAPSSNISEQDIAEAEGCYQKEPRSLPSANMHRPAFDNRSSVGLGLDLDAEHRSSECQVPHRPMPSSSSQTSANACTVGAAASSTHGNECDEFGRVAPYFQAFGNSLRTVHSRWMMSSSPVFDTVAEEMGHGVPVNDIPDDVVMADVSGSGSESVEIMVMRRSEGLDGM